jgi:hypothetical protein
MGIRLDWEIQAEQSQVQNTGEDPLTKRARRAARLRLLAAVGVLAALIGALVMAVALRLNEVDAQIEQGLRDTVTAEVTALRIDDRQAFMCLQHLYDANSDWREDQLGVFDNYQQLKSNPKYQIELSGRIADVTIEERRARVQIEQIINNTAYTQVWFYWRFPTIAANDTERAILEQREREIGISCQNLKLENLWLHVPPDYTFWGDVRTYVGNGVRVRYQTVDEGVAAEIGLRIKDWLHLTCGILTCGQLPEIAVEIIPKEGLEVGWSPTNVWLLEIPSPFTKMARSDKPYIEGQIVLDQTLEVQVTDSLAQIANVIAERLVTLATNNLQPVYPADAYFLRQSVVSWLVGQYINVNTNTYLIDSLADAYGNRAVGSLLQLMNANSTMSILGPVTGVTSLEQANLDWRDLLTWRLNAEDELIKRGELTNLHSLYIDDELIRSAATTRYNANATPVPKTVVLAQLETASGLPTLRATVRVGEGDSAREEQVLFRLVNNTWLRAS